VARTETVTVVFTDLVGSTELASRLGHDAYETLRQAHFTALRASVAKHNGTEVKTTGDGLMLRFDSAASAVACGIAMQQMTDGRSAGREPLQIRVGVSTGEATEENRDLFGSPVVEAARLCAVAAAGQIVISDVVRSLARGRGHTFTSLGELTLKGLPEPVASFAVQWAPLAVGMPLPARLTKAPLAMFGRDAESAALSTAWAKAKEGQRQLVLIAGEPGIGKTRLATEAALAAHTEGAVVLLGTCDEDVNLPYQPFVEALRHYVAHAPEHVLDAHVREHKGELVRLTPELARRVANPPAPQVAEAETERYLLFDAVTGLLSEASKQQPVVLVLDDLHWAGAPELLLLRHILKTTMPLRVLIIGTYRDTDLTRTHPLTAMLADWRRETGVERIALHGIDEAAVVGLVAAAAGHDLTEPGIALARALHQETEGSPFFIGEILRHLSESGAIFQQGDRWIYKGDIASLGIPEGIKEVIGRRLNRLSAATNKVLTLAAVIGRQFDLSLLTRIAETREEEILDALDEAVAAALVAEVPSTADRFAFSHALIRTTLYEELTAARRARLHRRVGETLEELTGVDPNARIDELAHHWLAATQVGDQLKAVGYARQAGDRALANLAFEEAAAHYERALFLLTAHDRAGEELRCDLLIALGVAQHRAGVGTYREPLTAAADLARRLGDAARLGRAALAHARVGGLLSTAATVDEPLIALYEEAVAGIEGDSTLKAQLLAQLAAELMYGSALQRRDQVSRAAVEMARQLGDQSTLALTLSARAYAICDPSAMSERLRLAKELRTVAAALASLELQFLAAYHAAGPTLESGDVRGFEQLLGVLDEVAPKLRQPYLNWVARFFRATLAILRGEPDAEQQAYAAYQVGTASNDPDAALVLGTHIGLIRWDQGRADEVTAAMQQFVEKQPHGPGWRAGLAIMYCELDRLDEARAHLDIFASQTCNIEQNWSWDSAWAMVLWATPCAELRDRNAAAVFYRYLEPFAGQVTMVSNVVGSCGSFAWPCGMLAAVLERWDEAERHFNTALAMNDRIGARPWNVRTRRSYAEMLLDRAAPGDRERARELVAAGRAEAEQLGMARELVRFERLTARLTSA
jgi:class 3 adenylate cyclase/tetratricopeptide (TPR) repeat protein